MEVEPVLDAGAARCGRRGRPAPPDGAGAPSAAGPAARPARSEAGRRAGGREARGPASGTRRPGVRRARRGVLHLAGVRRGARRGREGRRGGAVRRRERSGWRGSPRSPRPTRSATSSPSSPSSRCSRSTRTTRATPKRLLVRLEEMALTRRIQELKSKLAAAEPGRERRGVQPDVRRVDRARAAEEGFARQGRGGTPVTTRRAGACPEWPVSAKIELTATRQGES